MRLLTLRNRGAHPKRVRIAPFFDLALEDSPEFAAWTRSVTRRSARRCCSRIPTTTSSAASRSPRRLCEGPTTETIRTRFFGGPGRNILTPVDGRDRRKRRSVSDDGRRVAAFCGEITLPPGGEAKIAIGFGQASSRDEALAAAARVDVANAQSELAATRASWARAAGQGRGPHQPAGLRRPRQYVAALPALRLSAVRPRRAQPARRSDRLSRPVARRAAARSPRTAAHARADRAARQPAVSRRRRAQVVASRARRRHGHRPAHQGERPASLAALCAGALCAPKRRSNRAR